jgi:hypothetical protein
MAKGNLQLIIAAKSGFSLKVLLKLSPEKGVNLHLNKKQGAFFL